MKGKYKIQVNYYRTNSQEMLAPLTVQVDIYTNYGHANERKQSLTVRPGERGETVTVGEIKW